MVVRPVRLIDAIVIALLCAIGVSAWDLTAPPSPTGVDLGQIYTDSRSAPPAPTRAVRRRQSNEDTSSSSADSSSETSTDSTMGSDDTSVGANATTSSFSRSQTVSTLVAQPTATSTSLPQPFDSSLGRNFTAESCPSYMTAFLNNATFKSCEPISLLLQNSFGFFKAAATPDLLNRTLDASCSASFSTCSSLMASIATNLIADSNCGRDFRRQNPIVTQAYAGLLAYEPVYNAACLKDPTARSYCLAEALTNKDHPNDSVVYQTAVGIELPSSALPSCSICLQNTMKIFAGAAQVKGQPLASTYNNAAQQIDDACGSSFVQTQIQVAVQSTSAATKVAGLCTAALTALASFAFLFVLA